MFGAAEGAAAVPRQPWQSLRTREKEEQHQDLLSPCEGVNAPELLR